MFERNSLRWMALVLVIAMVACMMPQMAIAGNQTSVTNYSDFMTNLKVLEGYADEYAAEIYGKDPGELVLNFIRTGVERYQDDNWNTLAGPENTGFSGYVEAQDEANGTNAMALRDIDISNFTLPNGNKADFGHMFGCMNISYVAGGSADLSGWAGDLCDLLQYSVAHIDEINANTDGSVEEMAAYIQENCFGVDASGAFGWDDFYGDMDAYYLVTEYKKAGGAVKFSALMEAYFKADLDDTDRTVYFMNNRFGVADNKEAVRKAIFESYSTDVGISILEAKRGLSTYSALREACCYALADYIYSKAAGQLVEGAAGSDGPANGYYSVFSNEHSILAPGITQDINYAQTADGKQIVYYVATVDVKRPDVEFFVNYNNNEAPVGNNIGLQSVRDQVAALVENNKDKEHFYPIVATNGAGYNISNGTPAGLVVMQGVEYYPVGAPGFFAILEDGTAVIGDQAKYEELQKQDANRIKEAIQAFGSVLIKDGKINVTKSPNYTSNRASRTAIGITADGKVVMMVLDGRQLPRSAGGSLEEIAQIMLEAGCVQAVNLDGGGSTTYLSKPAGSDDIQLVNVPSDGYERNVATSLVVVSTAPPSTAFDSAIISSDYDYITAGTSMQFNATGVSNTGNAAAIPDDAFWRVSDESIATIDENGVFTALDYGTVTVEFVVGGEVVGSKVIQVVIPDDIKFAEDRITAVYGKPKELTVTVWYQGYPVAFTPYVDAIVLFADTEDIVSPAGIIDGMTFIGDETSGVRTVNVLAVVATAEEEVVRFATINLYYDNETTFDFANATQGNRSFAWNRVIENARTLDNQFYRISDPNAPMVIEYTFALDMTAIDFPAQLEPMKSMLPTYNENATAWDYLLQLAERVCTQTSVTITTQFSPDLEVDISELQILTDYFTATSITLDANNVLTIVCNWVDQTQPIDPATANSLCILTGITATVKDTAAYYDNKIAITNNGAVTYDIYLAASSLYSFASDPANQAKYGIYPYIHDENCRGGFSTPEADETGATNNDRGAHFSSQYIDFQEVFIISSEVLNGWHQEGKDYYYYVNNEPLTGIQLVPDRHDSTKDRFYEFDETGKLVSEQGTTGLIEFNGGLYYAVLGVAQTGWQNVNGNDYYFHPDTCRALDGVQQIKEFVYPASAATDPTTATYTYTFTNYILTRGDLRRGESAGGITGTRYRWAGDWVADGWFEVDGNTYHVDSHQPINGKANWGCFITTGYGHYISTFGEHEQNTYCYLFDENGVLQKDFTGAADTKTHGYRYFVNGVMIYNASGIFQGDDGYYYYVNWDGTVVVNSQQSVTAYYGRGYVSAGTYTFDAQGRMTDALVTVTQQNTTAEVSVKGVVATVKNDLASVILCKVGNEYVSVRGTANGNGTYNFIIPKGATEVKLWILGDVDGDGVLAEADMNLLNQAVMGEASLTSAQRAVLDINGNGELNLADITLLARALLDPSHVAYKALQW